MKKIYLFLTALLLATALQAATNVNSPALNSPDGDESPENSYQLTVNVNATDTTLANVKILYSSSGFGSSIDSYSISQYQEFTNRTPTALPRGNYYVALVSTKFGRYSYAFPVISQKQVQLTSDQTIDFNFHKLTVDFDLPDGAEDHFYTRTRQYGLNNSNFCEISLGNQNSIEVFEGNVSLTIYDKNNYYQIASYGGDITSDQTQIIPFHTLTVSTNASEEVMNLSEIRVYNGNNNQYYTLANNGSVVLPEGSYSVRLVDKDLGTTTASKSITLSSDQTVSLNNYNLTVNLNTTHPDNLILIYSNSEYNVRSYYGDGATIIENHSSISLLEGTRIYVGVYDKKSNQTLEYKKIEMEADQTVDFDINFFNLTINLNATRPDNLILIYSRKDENVFYYNGSGATIIENHSSISFSDGTRIYVGVYDNESKKTLAYKEVVVRAEQTLDFNIKDLTVNFSATRPDNLILIYSSDEYYVRYYQDYGERATIMENQSPVSFSEGTRIYVGVYDKESQETVYYKEVVMDSDKTEDFKLNLVSLNISAPAEIQDDIDIYLSSTSSTNYYYKEINGSVLVPDGKYEIEVHTSRQTIYKTLDVTEDASFDIKINKLAITCQDIDGNVASDIALQLRLNKNDGYSSYRTDENGLVNSYWFEGDTVRITPEDNNFDVSNYIVIMSEDKNVTLKVPNKITFKLYVDGRPYTNYARIFNFDNQRMNCDDDDKGNYTLRYDSKHPLRLYMDDLHGSSTDCDEGFVAGYFIPTDGCKVKVASVSVQSDGKGLVFPRNDFQPQQIYRMFVGNVVRLAAVPVGDGEFVNWEINGKQYTQPLIDYTVTDDAVTAIAHFSGDVTTNVKGVTPPSSEQITVSIEGGFLRLPESVEGDASFYSVDGRMVKQVGVVGDRIVISDLPAGAYVLTLYVEGRILSARFVKP